MKAHGLFLDGETEAENYNRMARMVDSASSLDAGLASRMRATFRAIRQLNRQWDDLLDQLADEVSRECKRRNDERARNGNSAKASSPTAENVGTLDTNAES